MNDKEFIAKNKIFWDDYKLNISRKNSLLVEINGAFFNDFGVAISSLCICKAKNYKPIYIKGGVDRSDFFKSFDSQAEVVSLPKLSKIKRVIIKLKSQKYLIKIKSIEDILKLEYEGVKYGDIVYDTYLTRNAVSTIKELNKEVLYTIKRIFYECAYYQENIKKLLKTRKFDAVLVSHRIGIKAGILYRVAMNQNYPIYSVLGESRYTIKKSLPNDKVVDYELTPTKKEINDILALDESRFNKLYEFVNNLHINGGLKFDSKLAFDKNNESFKDKEDFCEKFGLNKDKKTVFVMLHVFIDSPHSHFDGMLFNDYFDWFVKTLEYANNDTNVNWIFKRHPSEKFYFTADNYMEEITSKKYRDHILILDSEQRIDTRNLCLIADAIITCMGSAGFELPAMGGVPSIIAGNCHYSGFEFAKNPKSKEEYYKILSKLKEIKPLSPHQQRVAKAMYIHIYYLSVIKWLVRPPIPINDMKHTNRDNYRDLIINIYNTEDKENIYNQIDGFSNEIKKEHFRVLRTKLK